MVAFMLGITAHNPAGAKSTLTTLKTGAADCPDILIVKEGWFTYEERETIDLANRYHRLAEIPGRKNNYLLTADNLKNHPIPVVSQFGGCRLTEMPDDDVLNCEDILQVRIIACGAE